MAISDALLLRLVASFIAGFAIVALVTSVADMFGEGPAGFFGGLPSTGPVGLLSIGFTQSTAAAVQAATFFPLGFGVTCSFLLFYTLPKKLHFWTRMAFSLCLWLILALFAAMRGPDDFVVSLVFGLSTSSIVLLARSRIKTHESECIVARPGWRLTLLRGLLGGSVVVVVAVLAIAGGPFVGGVFAPAPAVWSASLYVTKRAHGTEFSRSITLNFLKTAVLTALPFIIAVHEFFSVYGIWFGTALGYLAISPLAYVAWRWTNPRRPYAAR